MRPFPSFSLGIVLLGFATIASVLASAITPSDDGSSLLARAVGGKYVGSRCQQNSDCYSDRCVPTDDSTSTYKTCRRQVANGGCFKNDNFLSRNCTAGQCGSSSGGVCKADVDCDRSACRNGTCVSLSLGQSCTSGDQCKTTTCSAKHKVCILSPALVPCQKADQCYSVP
ncbi:unnamed protein product [Tilletia controversa]|nr:unnamed protein product [Tilletia controversa]